MIEWNTFRPFTNQEVYSSASSASYSQNFIGGTSWRSTVYSSLYSNGSTLVTFGSSESSASSNASGSNYYYSAYGQTFVNGGGLQSFNSSQSSMFSYSQVNSTGVDTYFTSTGFNFSSSTGITYSLEYLTTTNSTGSLIYTKTTNASFLSTYYTVTGSGTAAHTIIAGHSTLALTTTTGSHSFSYVNTLDSTTSGSSPFELGTIIRAGNERLYSYTATPSASAGFNSNFSALSAVAASFTQQTFWPFVGTSLVNYALTNSTTPEVTVTVDGYSTDVTTDYVEIVGTEATTLTEGGLFPRATFSSVANVYGLAQETTNVGQESYEIEAYSTYSNSVISVAFSQQTFKALIPKGLSNETTTVMEAPVSYLVTRSDVNWLPYYNPATSTSNSVSNVAYAAGQTQQSTASFNLYVSAGDAADAATNIAREVPFGAFVAPHNLDGGAFTFARNLSVAGSTIPFPYVSSVASEVVAPIVSKASYDDSTFTWRYAMEDGQLSYTKSSTHTELSGTDTVTITDSTTTSGSFSTAGSYPNYYANGGGVLGGYADISTAGETAYYGRGAVIGTSIATDGASATYSTVRNGYSSRTAQGAMFVEQSVPAIVTNVGTDGGAGIPTLSYPRN